MRSETDESRSGPAFAGRYSDGASAAFYGLATNLVPGNDQNAATDVWLRF